MKHNPSGPQNIEQLPESLCFSGFLLDTNKWTLTNLQSPEGEEASLDTRAIKVLAYLVAQRHRVVSKDELFEQVWGQQIVSDNALTQAITRVRRALGEDSRHANQIQTVRNRGYRFVGEVEEPPIAGQVIAPAAVPRRRWPWAIAAAAVLTFAVSMLIPYGRQPATVVTAVAPVSDIPLLEQLVDVQLDIHGLDDDPLAQAFAASVSEGLRVALPVVFAPGPSASELESTERPQLTGVIFTRGHESVISLELSHPEESEPLWKLEDKRVSSVHSLRFRERLADTLAALTRRPVHPDDREQLRLPVRQPKSAFELLVKGRQFYLMFDQSSNEQSIEHYQRALALRPDWFPAKASMALSIAARRHRYRLDQKWLDEATMLAREAVSQSRNAYDAWRALGMVAIERGQAQLALEYFQTALVLAPNHYPTIYTVGLTLYNLGRVDEAIAVYTRIQDLPMGRALLMGYLVELGLDEEVDRLSQKPFDNAREFALANYALLYRAAISGDYEQARELGDTLRDRYPVIEPALLRVCGEVEQRAGNAHEAARLFKKAYDMDPKHADTRIRMAELWQQEGQNERAETELIAVIEELTAGVRSGTGRWTEMREIALAEALRGHIDQALKWRERAIDAGAYADAWEETDSRFKPLAEHPQFIAQTLKMQARVTQMRSRALDSLLAGAPEQNEGEAEEP